MNNLKFLRVQKNLSQKELAKVFNVAPSTYNQWETGKREPDLAALTAIADFYGVTIDELVGREPIKKEPVPDINVGDKLDGAILTLFSQLTEAEKSLILASVKGILSDHK